MIWFYAENLFFPNICWVKPNEYLGAQVCMHVRAGKITLNLKYNSECGKFILTATDFVSATLYEYFKVCLELGIEIFEMLLLLSFLFFSSPTDS